MLNLKDLKEINNSGKDYHGNLPIEIAIGRGIIESTRDLIVQSAENAVIDRSAHRSFRIMPIRIYEAPDLNEYDYRIFLTGKLKVECDLRTDMFMTLLNSGGLPEDYKYIEKLRRLSTTPWTLGVKYIVKTKHGKIVLNPEDILTHYFKKLIDDNISDLRIGDHLLESQKNIITDFNSESEISTLCKSNFFTKFYRPIKEIFKFRIPHNYLAKLPYSYEKKVQRM